jgi:hypothetical protein
MIAPGNGAEELYVNTLIAHRVRAVRLAEQERVPGERPWQRYDQAFRDAVEKVGPAFPERNLGLVEWAELRAREVLAGEIDPAVEAILNPLAEPVGGDTTESAVFANLPPVDVTPEPDPEPKAQRAPQPEPEKKGEAKKPEARKDEPKKEEPKRADTRGVQGPLEPQPKPTERDWFNAKPAEKKKAP